MKRKLLAILTSVLLLCAMSPLNIIEVSAATSGITGDCTWTLVGTHLIISGNGTMANYEDYISGGAGTPMTLHSTAPWSEEITSVTIEDGVTNIGDNAFLSCHSLTAASIGNSVTSIGRWAFAYTSLISLTIPDSVISIAENAFQSCTSWKEVTIGSGVKEWVFSGHQFVSINVDENNPYYCSVDDIVFSKDKTTIIQYPAGKDETSYDIANGVVNIGKRAFSNCTSLTSITIPNTITAIESEAFYNCTSLVSVAIPNTVTTIKSSAFYNCKSLLSVTIPKSITSIESEAFYNCTSLTEVHIVDVAAWCGIQFGDVNANPLYNAHYLYLNDDLVTNLIIPNNVITIGNYAFNHCYSITSLTIGDNIIDLGTESFVFCLSLTDVYFDSGEQERENLMKFPQQNNSLKNATWHYNCAHPEKNYSDVVEHSVMDTENGNGLAFRFKLSANEMAIKPGCITQADYTNATINYLGKNCQLIGMGAVVTNNAAIGNGNFTLNDISGKSVIDIPAVYLCDLELNSCSFAVRIINIPDTALNRTIYARPYYVVEVDGEEIVVYGDVDSASCAEYR